MILELMMAHPRRLFAFASDNAEFRKENGEAGKAISQIKGRGATDTDQPS